MKNFIKRMPIKILCFLLCAISLCTSAAGIIGGVIMASEDFYVKTADEIFCDEIGGKLRSYSEVVVDYTVRGSRIPDAMTSAQKTNVCFIIRNADSKIVDTNMLASNGNLSFVNGRSYYYEIYIYKVQGGTYVTSHKLDGDTLEYEKWSVLLGVREKMGANDVYAQIYELIDFAHSIRYTVIVVSALSFVAFIALFIVLMCTSGRRACDDGVHCGLLNSIPFDLLVASVAVVLAAFCVFIDELDRSLTSEALVAVAAFACFLAVCMVLGLCVSASARLKQGTLIKNTVLWRIVCLLRRGVNGAIRVSKRIFKRVWAIILAIPMIWRTAVAVCVITVYDIAMLSFLVQGADEIGTLMFFAKAIILGFAALSSAFQMRRLEKGADALAQGDLDYKVDTEKMYYDFKRHGENLNGISAGMAVAVEERLHSERMKAELITNVSHDIKTPLTSIINYAGLIAENECENEKHREYSEVLLRKSEHLKRLLDDLVEISKANSGTLEVALTPCDANVLLGQTAGEFEQKCADAQLTLVASSSCKNARIMADGRRIWRVFENLMNNAVKYSLPNSRVYLTLESDGQNVRFIFRNTSKNTLSLSAEELTERFVRGDSSRTTEGNGLGLSIAKSLTELQNGKMEIITDGDLFKVVLTFPAL